MTTPVPRVAAPLSASARAAWFVAGFAGATAIFLGYQLFFAPVPAVRVGPPPRPTLAPVSVHVVGEVANPAVYKLSAGSRVEDALHAAGGPTEQADPNLLNLAARLTDGQRLTVPRRTEPAATPPAQGADPSTAPARAKGRINLNTASLAELDTLPGVGPVTAQRVIEQRQKAPFTSVDQLLELKLVNAPTFERLKDLVAVE